MPEWDMVFRVGGEGGEGVISTGEMLTSALARSAYHIYTCRTYPAEIKGGHAVYQVRVSDHLLLSQGDHLDVLLAFNQEAYDKHHKDLKPNGVLVYNSDSLTPPEGAGYIQYGVPLSKIATEEAKLALSKNIVALGVLGQLFNVSLEKFEEVLREKFGRKGEEVLKKNIAALHAGAAYVQQHMEKRDPYRLEPLRRPQELVLSGNEAIGLGAIVAGCRLYAGYPITPATDIMEWLAKELPKVGGVVMQTEDEIAAIGVVLGASFAGKKAMSATSGPGFSLMVESLGLATMAEIPVVIVDCQRAGPSTGMPTKTEQGDLHLALRGAHGDAPRVVMALTSVEDCFYGMIRAFNLAEEYQTPVIVLSDQYLSHRKASVPKPDIGAIKVVERLRPTPEEITAGYRRFRVTETGVSPMALPQDDGGFYTATGIEHDEMGGLSYEPENHWQMTEKRHRKLEQIRPLSNELCRRYGHERPEIGVIGWGSSEGVIREAIVIAEKKGCRVAALHPKILNPFPTQRVQEFLKDLKHVIIPEVNYSGQFAALLLEHVSAPVVRLNKCGGVPFAPQEIVQKIEEVITNHG